MKPCRIEFESYSYSGENYEITDKNNGQVVLISSSIEEKHFKPISFFSNDLQAISLHILEPLITHFSGITKDTLVIIDLSEHKIILPSGTGYGERLLGKVLGCKIIEGFPYDMYDFGFTPFSFFFTAYSHGDPISDCTNQRILKLLTDAKQIILNAYIELILKKNQTKSKIYGSDFLWESTPRNGLVWNCWQCYFSSKKYKQKVILGEHK